MHHTERHLLRGLCTAATFTLSASMAFAAGAPVAPVVAVVALAAVAPVAPVVPGEPLVSVAPGAPGALIASGTSKASLVLKHPLRARIVLPDGEMATMYTAEKDGRPALALRHGGTLSVSSRSAEGTHRTTYDAAHPSGTDQFVPNAGVPGEPIDREPGQMARMGAYSAVLHQDDPATSLHFSVFVHDDVTHSIDRIFDVHFAHWVEIMEKELFPGRQIFVSMYRHKPGLTDVTYGKQASIQDWSRAVAPFHEPTLDQPGAAAASRKMLLVGGKIVYPGAVGVAKMSTWTAMASISANPDTPAHEFGHLFGATHKNARRWGDPRLGNCVTIMWHEAGNTSCRDYSLSNREVIQASGIQ